MANLKGKGSGNMRAHLRPTMELKGGIADHGGDRIPKEIMFDFILTIVEGDIDSVIIEDLWQEYMKNKGLVNANF